MYSQSRLSLPTSESDSLTRSIATAEPPLASLRSDSFSESTVASVSVFWQRRRSSSSSSVAIIGVQHYVVILICILSLSSVSTIVYAGSSDSDSDHSYIAPQTTLNIVQQCEEQMMISSDSETQSVPMTLSRMQFYENQASALCGVRLKDIFTVGEPDELASAATHLHQLYNEPDSLRFNSTLQMQQCQSMLLHFVQCRFANAVALAYASANETATLQHELGFNATNIVVQPSLIVPNILLKLARRVRDNWVARGQPACAPGLCNIQYTLCRDVHGDCAPYVNDTLLRDVPSRSVTLQQLPMQHTCDNALEQATTRCGFDPSAYFDADTVWTNLFVHQSSFNSTLQRQTCQAELLQYAACRMDQARAKSVAAHNTSMLLWRGVGHIDDAPNPALLFGRELFSLIRRVVAYRQSHSLRCTWGLCDTAYTSCLDGAGTCAPFVNASQLTDTPCDPRCQGTCVQGQCKCDRLFQTGMYCEHQRDVSGTKCRNLIAAARAAGITRWRSSPGSLFDYDTCVQSSTAYVLGNVTKDCAIDEVSKLPWEYQNSSSTKLACIRSITKGIGCLAVRASIAADSEAQPQCPSNLHERVSALHKIKQYLVDIKCGPSIPTVDVTAPHFFSSEHVSAQSTCTESFGRVFLHCGIKPSAYFDADAMWHNFVASGAAFNSTFLKQDCQANILRYAQCHMQRLEAKATALHNVSTWQWRGLGAAVDTANPGWSINSNFVALVRRVLQYRQSHPLQCVANQCDQAVTSCMDGAGTCAPFVNASQLTDTPCDPRCQGTCVQGQCKCDRLFQTGMYCEHQRDVSGTKCRNLIAAARAAGITRWRSSPGSLFDYDTCVQSSTAYVLGNVTKDCAIDEVSKLPWEYQNSSSTKLACIRSITKGIGCLAVRASIAADSEAQPQCPSNFHERVSALHKIKQYLVDIKCGPSIPTVDVTAPRFVSSEHVSAQSTCVSSLNRVILDCGVNPSLYFDADAMWHNFVASGAAFNSTFLKQDCQANILRYAQCHMQRLEAKATALHNVSTWQWRGLGAAVDTANPGWSINSNFVALVRRVLQYRQSNPLQCEANQCDQAVTSCMDGAGTCAPFVNASHLTDIPCDPRCQGACVHGQCKCNDPLQSGVNCEQQLDTKDTQCGSRLFQARSQPAYNTRWRSGEGTGIVLNTTLCNASSLQQTYDRLAFICEVDQLASPVDLPTWDQTTHSMQCARELVQAIGCYVMLTAQLSPAMDRTVCSGRQARWLRTLRNVRTYMAEQVCAPTVTTTVGLDLLADPALQQSKCESRRFDVDSYCEFDPSTALPAYMRSPDFASQFANRSVTIARQTCQAAILLYSHCRLNQLKQSAVIRQLMYSNTTRMRSMQHTVQPCLSQNSDLQRLTNIVRADWKSRTLPCPAQCTPSRGICSDETGRCYCNPGLAGPACTVNLNFSASLIPCDPRCKGTCNSGQCICDPLFQYGAFCEKRNDASSSKCNSNMHMAAQQGVTRWRNNITSSFLFGISNYNCSSTTTANQAYAPLVQYCGADSLRHAYDLPSWQSVTHTVDCARHFAATVACMSQQHRQATLSRVQHWKHELQLVRRFLIQSICGPGRSISIADPYAEADLQTPFDRSCATDADHIELHCGFSPGRVAPITDVRQTFPGTDVALVHNMYDSKRAGSMRLTAVNSTLSRQTCQMSVLSYSKCRVQAIAKKAIWLATATAIRNSSLPPQTFSCGDTGLNFVTLARHVVGQWNSRGMPPCGVGCTPARGFCDDDTGICHCHTGFTGANCNETVASQGETCGSLHGIYDKQIGMCRCWSGPFQYQNDSCSVSPCSTCRNNGGTCSLDLHNKFLCSNCPPGFTGVYCESAIDKCLTAQSLPLGYWHKPNATQFAKQPNCDAGDLADLTSARCPFEVSRVLSPHMFDHIILDKLPALSVSCVRALHNLTSCWFGHIAENSTNIPSQPQKPMICTYATNFADLRPSSTSNFAHRFLQLLRHARHSLVTSPSVCSQSSNKLAVKRPPSLQSEFEQQLQQERDQVLYHCQVDTFQPVVSGTVSKFSALRTRAQSSACISSMYSFLKLYRNALYVHRNLTLHNIAVVTTNIASIVAGSDLVTIAPQMVDAARTVRDALSISVSGNASILSCAHGQWQPAPVASAMLNNTSTADQNHCFCEDGFYGALCNMRVESCFASSLDNSPCSGNGMCDSSSAACKCATGFFGSHCASRIPTHCEAGGIPDVRFQNATCICPFGTAGAHCELGETQCPDKLYVPTFISTIRATDPHQCSNLATMPSAWNSKWAHSSSSVAAILRNISCSSISLLQRMEKRHCGDLNFLSISSAPAWSVISRRCMDVTLRLSYCFAVHSSQQPPVYRLAMHVSRRIAVLRSIRSKLVNSHTCVPHLWTQDYVNSAVIQSDPRSQQQQRCEELRRQADVACLTSNSAYGIRYYTCSLHACPFALHAYAQCVRSLTQMGIVQRRQHEPTLTTVFVHHFESNETITPNAMSELTLALRKCKQDVTVEGWNCSGVWTQALGASTKVPAKCICNNGYTGPLCNQPIQSCFAPSSLYKFNPAISKRRFRPPPCSGGGACMTDGSCKCASIRYGQHCEHFRCPYDCSGYAGACDRTTGRCQCPYGTSGYDCRFGNKCAEPQRGDMNATYTSLQVRFNSSSPPIVDPDEAWVLARNHMVRDCPSHVYVSLPRPPDESMLGDLLTTECVTSMARFIHAIFHRAQSSSHFECTKSKWVPTARVIYRRLRTAYTLENNCSSNVLVHDHDSVLFQGQNDYLSDSNCTLEAAAVERTCNVSAYAVTVWGPQHTPTDACAMAYAKYATCAFFSRTGYPARKAPLGNWCPPERGQYGLFVEQPSAPYQYLKSVEEQILALCNTSCAFVTRRATSSHVVAVGAPAGPSQLMLLPNDIAQVHIAFRPSDIKLRTSGPTFSSTRRVTLLWPVGTFNSSSPPFDAAVPAYQLPRAAAPRSRLVDLNEYVAMMVNVSVATSTSLTITMPDYNMPREDATVTSALLYARVPKSALETSFSVESDVEMMLEIPLVTRPVDAGAAYCAGGSKLAVHAQHPGGNRSDGMHINATSGTCDIAKAVRILNEQFFGTQTLDMATTMILNSFASNESRAIAAETELRLHQAQLEADEQLERLMRTTVSQAESDTAVSAALEQMLITDIVMLLRTGHVPYDMAIIDAAAASTAFADDDHWLNIPPELDEEAVQAALSQPSLQAEWSRFFDMNTTFNKYVANVNGEFSTAAADTVSFAFDADDTEQTLASQSGSIQGSLSTLHRDKAPVVLLASWGVAKNPNNNRNPKLGQNQCSGTVVGPRLVLTAAHCVVRKVSADCSQSRNNRGGTLEFITGFDAIIPASFDMPDQKSIRPFGAVRAKAIWVDQDYIINGGPHCKSTIIERLLQKFYKVDSDVALIEVNWDIGLRTGYQGVGMNVPLDTSVALTSFGYPGYDSTGRRNFRTMYDSFARTKVGGDKPLWISDASLAYRIQSAGGRSGSGLRLNNAVVCVHDMGNSGEKIDSLRTGYGTRALPPLIKLTKQRRIATTGTEPAQSQLVLDQRNGNSIKFSLQKGSKLEAAVAEEPFTLAFSVLNVGTSSSAQRTVKFTLFTSNTEQRWFEKQIGSINPSKSISIAPKSGSFKLPSIAVGASYTATVEFELTPKEAESKAGRWWLTASWQDSADYQHGMHALADAQYAEAPILIGSVDCSKMNSWVGSVAATFERGTQAMIQCSRLNSVQQCQAMFGEMATALMFANGLSNCQYVFVKRIEVSESSQGYATWSGFSNPQKIKLLSCTSGASMKSTAILRYFAFDDDAKRVFGRSVVEQIETAFSALRDALRSKLDSKVRAALSKEIPSEWFSTRFSSVTLSRSVDPKWIDRGQLQSPSRCPPKKNSKSIQCKAAPDGKNIEGISINPSAVIRLGKWAEEIKDSTDGKHLVYVPAQEDARRVRVRGSYTCCKKKNFRYRSFPDKGYAECYCPLAEKKPRRCPKPVVRGRTRTTWTFNAEKCRCDKRVVTLGDPHLMTNDGYLYDYQGIGSFLYCASNEFVVHTCMEPLLGRPTAATVHRAFAIQLLRTGTIVSMVYNVTEHRAVVHINGDHNRFASTDTVQLRTVMNINSTDSESQSTSHGELNTIVVTDTVKRSGTNGEFVYITSSDGDVPSIQLESSGEWINLEMGVPDANATADPLFTNTSDVVENTATRGLCGNNNGDMFDDVIGSDVNAVHAFGESWRLQPHSSANIFPPGFSCKSLEHFPDFATVSVDTILDTAIDGGATIDLQEARNRFESDDRLQLAQLSHAMIGQRDPQLWLQRSMGAGESVSALELQFALNQKHLPQHGQQLQDTVPVVSLSTFTGPSLMASAEISVEGALNAVECCNSNFSLASNGTAFRDCVLDVYVVSNSTGKCADAEAVLLQSSLVQDRCPDACSGHGYCKPLFPGSPTYECTCFVGYIGDDCNSIDESAQCIDPFYSPTIPEVLSGIPPNVCLCNATHVVQQDNCVFDHAYADTSLCICDCEFPYTMNADRDSCDCPLACDHGSVNASQCTCECNAPFAPSVGAIACDCSSSLLDAECTSKNAVSNIDTCDCECVYPFAMNSAQDMCECSLDCVHGTVDSTNCLCGCDLPFVQTSDSMGCECSVDALTAMCDVRINATARYEPEISLCTCKIVVTPLPPPPGPGSSNLGIIVGVSCGVGAFAFCVFVILRRRRRKQKASPEMEREHSAQLVDDDHEHSELHGGVEALEGPRADESHPAGAAVITIAESKSSVATIEMADLAMKRTGTTSTLVNSAVSQMNLRSGSELDLADMDMAIMDDGVDEQPEGDQNRNLDAGSIPGSVMSYPNQDDDIVTISVSKPDEQQS
jgi:hypothetical protein